MIIISGIYVYIFFIIFFFLLLSIMYLCVLYFLLLFQIRRYSFINNIRYVCTNK